MSSVGTTEKAESRANPPVLREMQLRFSAEKGRRRAELNIRRTAPSLLLNSGLAPPCGGEVIG